MIIRCWGSRGSIPVSGPEYLKYGGDTTCMEIRTQDDEIIIIDAGSGIRKLGNRLLSEHRHHYNMIFTHAHWDHLLGFPFFRPIYVKNTSVNMYGCPFAQESIREMISAAMKPPYFPVNLDDIQATISYHGICEETFSIGSAVVIPMLLSHPNQGIGYKIVDGDKSFVFLTDNELTFKHPGGRDYKDYVEFSADADLLIHDAEFTAEEYEKTRTWGHSVYTDALALAMEANVKQFGLFHLNQDRSDDEVDEMLQHCRAIIEGSKSSLECFAACQGVEIVL